MNNKKKKKKYNKIIKKKNQQKKNPFAIPNNSEKKETLPGKPLFNNKNIVKNKQT
jgi:hypothetical protein